MQIYTIIQLGGFSGTQIQAECRYMMHETNTD